MADQKLGRELAGRKTERLAQEVKLVATPELSQWGPATNQIQLSIMVKEDGTPIEAWQPVTLVYRIRNGSSNETIQFFKENDVPFGMDPVMGLRCVILSPSGKDVSPRDSVWAGSHIFPTLTQILPGQTGESEFALSKLYEFTEVGTYKIMARKDVSVLRTNNSEKMMSAFSKPLEVVISENQYESESVMTNGLRMWLELKSRAATIKTNPPIEMVLRFRNISTNQLVIPRAVKGSVESTICFEVSRPSGRKDTIGPQLDASTTWPPVELKPGAVSEVGYNFSSYYSFKESGTHTITCKKEFQVEGTGEKRIVVSNPLKVAVLPW